MRKILFITLAWMAACTWADTINYVREVLVDTDSAEFLYQYYYNESSQLAMELQRVRSNGNWANVARTEWYYEDDKLVRQQMDQCIGDEWQNVQNEVLTYNNELLAEQTLTNMSSGEVQTTAYEYKNGRLALRKHTLNGVQDYSYSFVYNAQGKTERVLITMPESKMQVHYAWMGDYPKTQTIQTWQDTAWVNQLLYTFYYNEGEDVPVKVKTSVWKLTNKGWMWINQAISQYEYNNGFLAMETNQYWAQMFWQDNFRFAYQYDGERLSRRIFDIPLYRKWRTQSYIQYAYADNTESAESVYEFWGGEEGEGFQTAIPVRLSLEEPVTTKVGNRIQVTYGTSPLVAIDDVTMPKVSVLPNPSDGVFYINGSNENNISWSVYDLNGGVVAQQNNVSSHMVDITPAPEGVYLLKLISAEGTSYTKLIKK